MTKKKPYELLLEKEQVFLLNEGKTLITYLCKGNNNKVYEILYNKKKDTFTCNCNNIRNTKCKHIKAVEALQKNELQI